MLGILLAGALALVVSGCGALVRSGVDDGKVKIGLFAPQSGVFASFGQDMKRSYDLYLSRHGGRLGGREVETVLADEGATPQTAVTAAQKVLQADRISVLTGIVSSASGLAVRPMAEVTRTPTVITVAGAGALTGSRGSDYVWRVGFGNAQPSYALGRSLAAKPDLVDKKFFLIAPGFAGGAETVEGFRRGFVEGGGKVVGRHFTVLGETSNFQPALQAAVQAGADDVFAFYAGSEALGFIQQYRRFGFADRLGLYGAGDLSDPHVLASAGAAAEGVQVAQTWSAELDTPANRAFVTAYEDAYHAVPSIASMNQYDAMVVLDQAVSGIRGPVTDKALIDALKNLGEVRNSVRGPWTFDPNHHDPYQTIYLLRVVKEGGRFVNKVVGDLGKVGFVNVESDV